MAVLIKIFLIEDFIFSYLSAVKKLGVTKYCF